MTDHNPPPGFCPHAWCKFAQAQENFLRLINMTRDDSPSGERRWNGSRVRRKTYRRAKMWARQSKHWLAKSWHTIDREK